MTSFDYAQLRAQSRAALKAADYSPKRIIWIHSGVSIGLGLLLTLLSYLLDMGVAQTGGLSGIGTRTVLETIRSLLESANMIFLPFWSVGYIRVVLNWIRREDAVAGTLLSGFRCIGGVLRLMILRGVLYAVLGLLGGYAGAAVFMLSPGARPLYQLLQEMVQSGVTDSTAIIESQAYQAAVDAVMPYMLVAAALVILPLAYRLRYAEFVLMDDPRMGALRSVLRSWRITRGNCRVLLKLDLRFWWYHLATLLIVALSYGDVLLSLAGVELKIGADWVTLAFYAAALLCELGLYVWKKNEVQTVYALAYLQLAMPLADVPVMPQPSHMSWRY